MDFYPELYRQNFLHWPIFRYIPNNLPKNQPNCKPNLNLEYPPAKRANLIRLVMNLRVPYSLTESLVQPFKRLQHPCGEPKTTSLVWSEYECCEVCFKRNIKVLTGQAFNDQLVRLGITLKALKRTYT